MTIFPVPDPDVGGKIGASFGRGGKRLSDQFVDMAFNRELLNKAVSKMQNTLSREMKRSEAGGEPRTDFTDLYFETMKPFVGIPGGEKWWQSTFTPLMRKIGLQDVPKRAGDPGIGSSGISPQERPGFPQERPGFPQERREVPYPGAEGTGPPSRVPSFPGTSESPYPEAEGTGPPSRVPSFPETSRFERRPEIPQSSPGTSEVPYSAGRERKGDADTLEGDFDKTLFPLYSGKQLSDAELQDKLLYGDQTPSYDYMKRHNENQMLQQEELAKQRDLSLSKRKDLLKVQKEVLSSASESYLQNKGLPASDTESIDGRISRFMNTIPEKHRAELAKMGTMGEKGRFIADVGRRYENLLQSFEGAARRPASFWSASSEGRKFRQSKMDEIGSLAGNLFRSGGASYDDLKEILAKQGWSRNEIAKILNPGHPKMKDAVSALPEYSPSPKSRYMPSAGPPFFRTLPPAEGVRSREEKEIYDNERLPFVRTFLKENIRPGSFENDYSVNPGTNILDLAERLMDRGYVKSDILHTINSLVDRGEITLDPIQRQDVSSLSSWLDSHLSWLEKLENAGRHFLNLNPDSGDAS